MPLSATQLKRQLREAGVANSAIDAVWPQWWSADASRSFSATVELTYTVARRLGMSPKALFDGSPEFLWRDETKFKNLGTTTERDQEILASFGAAVGRCMLRGTPESGLAEIPSANAIRAAILDGASFVELRELLVFCWAIGIPVIQLHIFPLGHKRMHAMTVRMDGRYAILIGRHSAYHAPTAYVLAHELAHISLGHLAQTGNLLEVESPLTSGDKDEEELAADRGALTMLTGMSDPQVIPDSERYGAKQLAYAAERTAQHTRIDPAVLALCAGYATKRWSQTFGALKILPPGPQDVGELINELANSQFDWSALSYGNREYLAQIMGSGHVAVA